MKRVFVITVATLSVMALCHVVADDTEATMALITESNHSAESVQQGLVMNQMDRQPIAFTENQGQWDKRVKFRAIAGGATLWFTEDGVYYQFTRRIPKDGPSPDDPVHMSHEKFNHEPDSIEQLVIKASFVGANSDPAIIGDNMMEYKCNYFFGNDPDEWHTDVPNYERVTLRNIYDGVDLQFHGSRDGKLMYRYLITPGADLDQILLAYDGLEETSFDEDGILVAQTGWGEINGLLAALPADADVCSTEFSLSSANTLLSNLDRSSYAQPSPQAVELVYSTYLGGGNADVGYGIAVNGSGNAYVTGKAWFPNFPTENPYQTDQAGADVFVTKLNSSGESLIYSTYLGGGDNDGGRGIAVDGSGNAYVTGFTESSDFPTQNPYQTDQGVSDVFVTKLSSSGNYLAYSTYIGGGDDDWAYGIAVDGSGNAYVTGFTESSDFPTQNPYQTDQGSYDVFVTKLNSSGESLIYSTYLSGGNYDFGYAIAVDGSGNAYVTGGTWSSDFPTQNPYQPTHQGDLWDIFVTKLSSSGESLVYSTYLGGGNDDWAEDIVVDGSGNAYVTGSTESSDFPTQNPYQTDQGVSDVFVTKLSSSGNYLAYSTYLGGGDDDWAYGIAVDGSGNAYVTGWTNSSDFPTQNPYQTTYQGSGDVFVTKLSSSGNYLAYSTYLGGGDDDYGQDIEVDSSGNAYVTGWTNSSDFPTQNPYQMDQGGSNVIVTKISETNGCLSGTVRRAGSSDTIPDATLWCTFGYGGTSDSLGQYSICQISPGYGFNVGVYAAGYVADTTFDVSISAGEVTVVDFALQPASFTSFRLRDLNVNPNPTVSTLVPGGKLHRYYILEDAISGTPVPGAQVLVPLSDSFPTNQDGVVDIKVISMDVGSGQPDDGSRTFDISEVIYDGVTYELEEPVSFQAAVVNQRYEFGWESSSYAKLGVSLYRSGEGFDSKISLVETDNDNIGFDSIGLIRQERDQEGAGYGIHTPVQIVWSDYGVGGGAGWEALKAKRLEDEYVFPYPNYTEMDAVNMYILFADGNVQTIDQVLIRLLSYLEVIYSGQSSLDAAYSSESKGIEFSAGVDGQIRYGPAPALANLVILNVGEDIGYGFSAYALMGYSHGSGTIHGLLGMSGRYNYGAWAGMMFPFLNDSPVTWDLSDYILPYRLGFDTEVSSGVELGAHFLGTEADPFTLSLRITHSDANDGIGREKSTFYQVSGLGIIDAIENSVEEYADVLNMRSGDVNIDVSNTTITGEMGDLFRLINDVQANGSDDAFVNFTRNDCEREEISSFDFKLAVGPFEDFISASVSEKTHFEQFTSYDTLVGAWALGKHYVLREDPKPVAGPVEYNELVSEICNKVPLWMRIAAFTWNTFGFPKAYDDAMTFFITDSTGIDTTGSLTYLPGSFPDTVTAVNCYSWGWWGSSPQTEKALLSNRALSICQRLKSAAEESRGMTYGYGGFYQFEPYGLELEDSAWLTMKYLQSEIEDFDEAELSMYVEDKLSQSWLLVGGEVDILSNSVTALISKLGTYTLAPRLPFGEIGLIPSPEIIPADSQSTTMIVSDTIRNNDGTVVIDGTEFNVIANGGRFITVDLDTSKAGLQVSSQSGIVGFELKSSLYAQAVRIEVLSTRGSAHGLTQVEFYDTGPPSPPILLSAIPGDGRIVVQWMSNPELDIKGYKIYFDSDNSGPPYNGTASIYGQPSPVDVGNDTVHTLTGLFNDSTYFISICAYDMSGNKSSYSEELTAVPSQYMCGDANGTGDIDIDDIIYLVNYIFLGGIPPDPLWLGDTNCSEDIDIDDIIFTVSYVFLGGNDPCDTDGDQVPDC